MRITKKKIAAVVAATTVVALGAGSAYAFFTSTGTGQGTGSVGTTSPWAISVSPLSGAPMFPGDSQTFSYDVTNNSSGPVTLNLVTAAVDDNGAGEVGATGCMTAWFSVSISGDPAGPVAPGASNHGTGTLTMLESGTNQDACKGTSPTFTLTAS